MKILYITYTGILEPLGQSQVLSYLYKLCNDHNCKITIISFEKKIHLDDNILLAKEKQKLFDHNIEWHYFIYKKQNRIIRTLLDIFKIYRVFQKINYNNKIDIVHCRSYISAIAGYIINVFHRVPYIFDMRGFWIDEMVMDKTLNNYFIFRILKFIENKLILSSSYIISLSNKAIDYLKSNKAYSNLNFIYIPTCVDIDKFKIESNVKKNEEITLGCVGTINSGWFLREWLGDFYSILLKIYPKTTLKIITNDDLRPINEIFKKRNINKYKILKCSFDEIASEINTLDLNIMFFSSNFAKIASCPTRLSESLACGVPCITNPGLGDIDEIFHENKIGVLLKNNNVEEMTKCAIESIKVLQNKNIKKNCRNTAIKLFDINLGVKKIKLVYEKILKI